MEARDGERYRIWVSTRSGDRVGLVIAVDGRNIFSGEQSHLRPHEQMYILGPYQSGEYGAPCKLGVIDCRRPHGGNRFWPDQDHDNGYAPPPPQRPYRGRE